MPKPTLVKTNTPGVYRRGGSYAYTYRVEGRQRWGSAATLDEARRKKRQAEADADRGELVELADVEFGAYAREWIAHYQGRTSNGLRESTRRSYRQTLESRVIPYFDGRVRLRLAQIQPRDVKAFVRWLIDQEDPRRPGRRLSKSAIRHHVAVLRALLGDAAEEGVIRSNPAAGVRVAVPEGDGTHPRLLFEFLAHTGLRIGEACELRWGRDVILTGRPHVKVRWQFADDRLRAQDEVRQA